MSILTSVLFTIYYIFLIITILIIVNISKEQDKLNKEALALNKTCLDLNRDLLKKMTKILLIIQSSEDPESKIEKIKEVIQSTNEITSK